MKITEQNKQNFFAKVRKTDGCWEWTGAKDSRGYGRLSIGNKAYAAHRVSLMIAGRNPGDLHACHRCDNPVCVNPDHLFLGTNADNMADCVIKGRSNRGVVNKMAKLTDDDIREIRSAVGTLRAIGKQFGISCTQAFRIRNRQHWKHVSC
jgi:hypothetical protein